MAKETIEDSKQESTSRSRRKKAGATEGDIDLASAAMDANQDEGFVNHPHQALEGALTPEQDGSSEEAASGSILGGREELVGQVREFASKAASRAQETYRNTSNVLREQLREMPNTGREAMTKIDSTTRENPWVAVGLASLGGLALGFLTARLFTEASES